MKKLKLWQKQYFATLLLFVLLFYGCVVFLAYSSFSSAFSVAQDAAAQEYSMIVHAIRADRAVVAARGDASEEADAAIVAEYGDYYRRRDIAMRYVSKGGVLLYNSLPENLNGSSETVGSLRLIEDENGERYFFASFEIGAGMLNLAKYTEELFADQRRQTMILLCTAVSFTALLTVSLYFTLKRIYRPIDNLAHELRTPLTAVNGYAQYIALAAIDEEERLNAASFIVSESRRLQEIVDKLLVLSNLKKGDLDRERVSVERLFGRAQQMYPGISCRAEWKFIMGDAVLLESLVGNLVDNAVKVSGGSDEVELLAQDGRIIVRDRGPGMSDDLIHRLNDPTNRERYSETGGAGLGVGICHKIAAEHGARLRFENRPDGGTVAEVKFS